VLTHDIKYMTWFNVLHMPQYGHPGSFHRKGLVAESLLVVMGISGLFQIARQITTAKGGVIT
jgi:hypothetical protein